MPLNYLTKGTKTKSALTYFLFFPLGNTLALGQAPFSLTYISIFSLPIAAFLWLKFANQPKRSFLVGGIWGLGYFSITMVWIVEPFMVEDEKYLYSLAPLALIVLSSYLSLFWAIAFYIAKYFGGGSKTRQILNLIILLTLAEVARSYFLGGFPWGLISYSLIDTPFSWLASVCGPYVLSSLIYFMFFSIIISLRWLLFNITLMLVLVSVSNLKYESSSPLKSANFNLKLIQPNISQSEKWDSTKFDFFYKKYVNLGTESPDSDIIIFPETAFATDSKTLPNFIKKLTGDLNSNAIVGVKRLDLPESRLYNSILFADRSGFLHSIYDKQYLVPFGEYIPLINLLIPKETEKIYGYSAGKEFDEISFINLPTLLPAICYEIIFSVRLGRRVKEAHWILNLTNDAWFGDFSGPQQHLVQARMRAIELGLPVVRVANTGITAIINADGKIISTLDLHEEGALNSKLPAKASSTPYLSLGPNNWLSFLIMLNLLAFFLINFVSKKARI